MTREELQAIKDGKNKNLRGASLREVDLRRANLREADLAGADMAEANLREADLAGADLIGANLRGANLRKADLAVANLTGAKLTGANLTGANLRGANLRWANLTEADLTWANLTGASLTGAKLTGANLTRANLAVANLRGADLAWADLREANILRDQVPQTIIAPDGTLMVWKKCQASDETYVLVLLEIPMDAKRSNATGRKCRSDKATPIKIEGEYEEVYSMTRDHPKKTYRIGEMVYCDKWEEDWKFECGGGIHWFLTREEAEAFFLYR